MILILVQVRMTLVLVQPRMILVLVQPKMILVLVQPRMILVPVQPTSVACAYILQVMYWVEMMMMVPPNQVEFTSRVTIMAVYLYCQSLYEHSTGTL